MVEVDKTADKTADKAAEMPRIEVLRMLAAEAQARRFTAHDAEERAYFDRVFDALSTALGLANAVGKASQAIRAGTQHGEAVWAAALREHRTLLGSKASLDSKAQAKDKEV